MAITMTKDVVFNFDSISVKELIESCKEETKNGCKYCQIKDNNGDCYFKQGIAPSEWISGK